MLQPLGIEYWSNYYQGEKIDNPIIFSLAGLLLLSILFGIYIIFISSAQSLSMVEGFKFIIIFMLLSLLAYLLIIIQILSDEFIIIATGISLLFLLILLTERIRTLLSLHKIFSILLWCCCIVGTMLFPGKIIHIYPIFIIDPRNYLWLSQFIVPTIIIIFLSIYLSLKFYSKVINKPFA
jgi:hypothetical protein